MWIIAELTRFGAEKGIAADWTAFTDDWRGLYQPSMEEVRSGRRPWAILDALHRESLDTLLAVAPGWLEGLSSPVVKEFSTSYGVDLANGKGFAQAAYIWRDWGNFIEDFIDDPTAAGKVAASISGLTLNVDRVIFDNTSDLERNYQAFQLESRVRFTSRLFVEGHWTVQIKNHGNFEGEAGNQPGNPSVFGDYPEMYTEAQHFPYGRLDELEPCRSGPASVGGDRRRHCGTEKNGGSGEGNG